MAYKSVYKGIIFIEGTENYNKSFGFIEYKKEKLYNNQLQNLDNVKEQLAKKAIELGANAVINFKYGQKNTSWFRSMLLAFDDNVNWFGTGEAVLINDDLYRDIIDSLNKQI